MTPDEQVTASAIHKPDCAGFESPRAEAHNICKSWCYGHMECEPTPDDVLIICGECFHVFANAEELLEMHNAASKKAHETCKEDGWLGSDEEWRPITDPDDVYFCPVCVHDF